MKTIIRLTRLLLRRPAPVHRGWQDFELGTYATPGHCRDRVALDDVAS